jgi:hypothetical protein
MGIAAGVEDILQDNGAEASTVGLAILQEIGAGVAAC